MAVYKSKRPTKDGRQYFFRIKYKDIFGVSHDYTSQKYKTKPEAVNEEAIYRIKVQKKETNTSNMTLKQIFEEYLLTLTVKPQSYVKIRNQFRHLYALEKIKINDLNLEKYRLWLTEFKEKNLSVSYANKILRLLKSLIRYSNKYYNTSDTLIKFIENIKEVNGIKKEMDFFTYEEYKKFDSAIDENKWHLFFEILYFMGLRQGECQAICWDDVDFNNNTIKISKTLTSKIKGEKWYISSPKTKSSIRALPMSKCLSDELKTLKKEAMEYKDFSEKWFVFGNSIPFKETTICNRKNKYCKIANLKQIRVHDFRHSCASFLINHGATPVLVAKYLGHSNVSMTLNTYSHMYKNELENIVKIIDNL